MRCLIKFPLLAAALMLLAAPAAQAAVCRVKTASDGGVAGNSGASWAQAKTLTAALADTGCGEIWVKAGLYKPEPPPPPSDPRLTHFEINRPVKLYGSFDGTESAPAQRSLQLQNRSILSADYNGDDPNQNGIDTSFDPNAMNENSLHVLIIGGVAKYGNGTYTKSDTLIDGFVITAGSASGGVSASDDQYPFTGGGLLCNGRTTPSNYDRECSPTLRNLWLTVNWASDGAGIAFVCQESGNCSPEIRNVTVSNNFGGGIYMDCNTTDVCGPRIFTSTVADNYDNQGGGLKVIGSVSGLLLNTTFSGNSNGYSTSNAIYIDHGSLQILGSILWGSGYPFSSVLKYANGGNALVQYSVLKGGCPAGTSTCDDVRSADPLLSSPAQFAGGYGPTVVLGEGSSAIDHGDQLNCPPNNSNFPLDQLGQLRPFDGDGDGQALCDAGSIEMHNSPTYQVVNTTDDHLPPLNDGLCSLREAVINATDNNMAWPDCGVQGLTWTDSILFDPTVFADDGNSTIQLAGELPIHNSGPARPGDLFIDGTRGDGGRVTLEAGANARVLNVDISAASSETRLYKLKISGGNPGGITYGGGVYLANGPLLIDDSVIDGNRATKGGGVYVAAGDPTSGIALTLRNSTVSSNTATGDNGGGVMVKDSLGPVRIDASTLTGNSAGIRGGGLMVDSGQVFLDRSTVSGNVLRANPYGRGIGVYASGAPPSGDTLTINHSTIALNDGNASTTGTGLYVDYGAHAAVNASAIAAQSGDDGCAMSTLGGGTAIAARYSLFEQGMGCVSNDQGNNLTGNPYLYGLNQNDGPTLSQMPRWVDSPLIDAVPCNLVSDPGFDNSADQRGIARPQDGNRNGDASVCDIGAVEVRGFAHQLTVQALGYLGLVTDNYATHEIENCGEFVETCQGTYAEGYDLVLTATPDPNAHFVEWYGDCSGTSPSISVPMLSDKTCNALFHYDEYTVTASAPGGHGSITPATQQVTHSENASFTVTPDTGYLVDSVSGDTCTPSDNGDGSWTANDITENCSVTAAFAIDNDTIFVNGFE